MKSNQPRRLSHKPTVVVYSFETANEACAVIRIFGPLLAIGWNVVWASSKDSSGFKFDIEVAHSADLILIQRMFPSKFTEKILDFALTLGVPIVFDLDDSFFDVPPHLAIYHSSKKHIPYIKWILKSADLITVSTAPLKTSLSRYTSRPIHVIPNILDFELFSSSPREHKQRFNFLVSGTNSHQKDWAIVEEPINRILELYGEKVSVTFFGDTPEKLKNHPCINIINFQCDYEKYASLLKKMDIHTALTPLEDTKYNHCKSNIKWLEYSAAGIPGIYSDLSPYNTCIQNDITGILVKNTPDAWFNAMNSLISDTEKRLRIAKNAQKRVLEQHSLASSLDINTSVIKSFFGKKHKHTAMAFTPIIHYRLYDNINKLLDRHLYWRIKKNN
ncbi:glycosyltransferase family protein [Methylomonas koyamae]|uniref:glycosyltransferase family protein n=1 Tax=Methylomonas koyamae TaxID=702114 RepID=UPI0028737142|nr:glycosyltransferase [Methylomonas koyamae]WNB78117.1 glycosyltransferase [Methylomonas koyamae]